MKPKDKPPMQLGCTRLADMTMMHPDQVEMECHNCHHKIGVYPSGQRALKRWPKMKPICINCVMLDRSLVQEFRPAAVSIDELLQETRESKPVVTQ